VEKRVLIVEDDAEIRSALASAFEDEGVRALVASDGRDALSKLSDGAPPAVILLDLRMPRIGGEAFLREMRADPRFEHVPVITMSAGAERTKGHDVHAYVQKSFDLDDLLRIVMSLVEANAA
jgi:CheY-like chemotaxis protein